MPSRSSLSTGLLQRVREHDGGSWQRLVELYGPLVYRWARKAGLQAADAEDVVSETFADVSRGIARFEKGAIQFAFRRWLWTIASRRILKHRGRLGRQPAATGGTTANVNLHAVPDEAESTETDERDEIDWVRRRAVEALRGEFSPEQWDVFWRTVVKAEPPVDVAKSLGLTVWAVYKIRSRVLHRLRTELSDM